MDLNLEQPAFFHGHKWANEQMFLAKNAPREISVCISWLRRP